MAEVLITSIPEECAQYKEDIRRFVDAMIYKLQIHAGKGRWEHLKIEDVLPKLYGEVNELEVAIRKGNSVEIQLEAADVANYALIAAAITVERGK